MPEHFGSVKLFRFRPLPESRLVIVPSRSEQEGVLGLFSNAEEPLEPHEQEVAVALRRFIAAYLQARQGTVDDPEFDEVEPTELESELVRARRELGDDRGQALLFGFAAVRSKSSSKPKVEGSGEPQATTEAADSEAAGGDAERIFQVIKAFANRVMTPGLWDFRPASPHEDLLRELSVFELTATAALAGLLPIHATDIPTAWDDAGIEVYAHRETDALLTVLFTGDPTAVFVGLSLPPGTDEAQGQALLEAADEFVLECGLSLGCPEPPEEDAEFVRLTDLEEIVRRLEAIENQALHLDVLSAYSLEDRPTQVSFETLARWVLGEEPPVLRQPSGRTPAVTRYRVYRHREYPLATLLVVTHSGGAAASLALFLPDGLDDGDVVPSAEGLGEDPDGLPEGFEELGSDEAAQQLRRVLVTIEAEGGLDHGIGVMGELPEVIRRTLVKAVAIERAEEFRRKLLSFPGVVETWLRREEHHVLRPSSFVARHRENPRILLAGASFAESEGILMWVVAENGLEVEAATVFERLNQVSPGATVEYALDEIDFELLDGEEARIALADAAERLDAEQAILMAFRPAWANQVH